MGHRSEASPPAPAVADRSRGFDRRGTHRGASSRRLVRRRVLFINALFVASALIGMVGAWEISRAAELQELNVRHLEYNTAFADALDRFRDQPTQDLSGLRATLAMVREQPRRCLEVAGPLERFAMRATGTFAAIALCEDDLALADETLEALEGYESGRLSARATIAALDRARQGFFANSVAFEPLVNRSVDLVFWAMMGLIAITSVLFVLLALAAGRSAVRHSARLDEARHRERDSRVRHELAIGGSSVGIWDYDLPDRAIFLSPQARGLLGIDDETPEPSTADVVERIHPEDRARLGGAFASHLERGSVFDVVFRVRRDDGHHLFLRARGAAVRGCDGSPVRMAGSLHDVTRERRLQQELERHQNELRLIFDTVPVRIWYKDDRNRILRVNRAAAESMRLSIAEIEGADTYELFPETAAKYHADDLEVIESGQPKLGIIEAYAPRDGERGWVRTDKVPYTDPETGRRYVLVVAQDVTRELRAQEAARSSDERFALAARGSSVGIWDWIDLEGGTEWWSGTFYELIGWDPIEMPASYRSFLRLLHPDDHAQTTEAVRRHLEEREPFRTKYRLEHKTEGYRWFLGSGQALWDEQGRPIRMIGSIMDIHDLQTTQETLEARTRDLEQSNRELDHFAYVASHDLRAPLRGMANLAAWIAEDLGPQADEDMQLKLELLEGRVQRMDALLSDILAYSRAGKRDTPPERVDVAALVEEIVAWIAPRDGVSVHVADDVPAITVSRTLLEQVFTNLLSNAVKHLDRPEGTIQVRYLRHFDRHELVVLDDGPGIPERYHDRVFQMFQTLRPRDQIEGSGIGLTIVQKRVQSAGGHVWLRSPLRRGRGTAVHFSLPVADDAEKDEGDA